MDFCSLFGRFRAVFATYFKVPGCRSEPSLCLLRSQDHAIWKPGKTKNKSAKLHDVVMQRICRPAEHVVGRILAQTGQGSRTRSSNSKPLALVPVTTTFTTFTQGIAVLVVVIMIVVICHYCCCYYIIIPMYIKIHAVLYTYIATQIFWLNCRWVDALT